MWEHSNGWNKLGEETWRRWLWGLCQPGWVAKVRQARTDWELRAGGEIYKTCRNIKPAGRQDSGVQAKVQTSSCLAAWRKPEVKIHQGQRWGCVVMGWGWGDTAEGAFRPRDLSCPDSCTLGKRKSEGLGLSELRSKLAWGVRARTGAQSQPLQALRWRPWGRRGTGTGNHGHHALNLQRRISR